MKKSLYLLMLLWLAGLIVWLAVVRTGLTTETAITKNIWWTGLLLFGAAITGFLFQPMLKTHFPSLKDSRVAVDPRFLLKDHEILMGYYPVVALVLFLGGLAISRPLYGANILFEIKSWHFWWATVATGILNVFIFYFLTKGFRYGDLSLVSVTQAMSPLFVLPISLAVFAWLGGKIPMANPAVSPAGFFGILITIAALALNISIGKKIPVTTSSPEGDWFASRPVISGLLGTFIGSVAVNFDKVAIDSANPFLMGIFMALIVSVITAVWTYAKGGWGRIIFIAKKYVRSFLLVGLVYGLVVLIMNVTLYGANVNYYATVKRTSAIFGIFYGIYVLKEGVNKKDRLVRVAVGVLVIFGILLITLKG
ncbi:MAG: hypothetical protein G01um101444_128 [Parcubacteria group bacterium Gr01-1014_44]|nr:MAG: hypothetical protein G01um101444_128 [Parcubacteria group bacterium Gr01-1014_44]